MGGLQDWLLCAWLDQAESSSDSLWEPEGPRPPAPAQPMWPAGFSQAAAWGSAGHLQGGPPLPSSLPSPKGPPWASSRAPAHPPQGHDQLPRFVWMCLFSPFLHHGLEGLAVQSPPVARKLKVTLKGDSCHRGPWTLTPWLHGRGACLLVPFKPSPSVLAAPQGTPFIFTPTHAPSLAQRGR